MPRESFRGGETTPTRYEHVDRNGLAYFGWLIHDAKAEHFCPRCEGDGSYTVFALCDSNGSDCACNGPQVMVDPCPVCNGDGEWHDQPPCDYWDEPSPYRESSGD